MGLAELLPFALGGLFLLGADAEPAGPPAPTVPPGPGGFTPEALEALTEVRTVDGHPCRFFRAPVATAVLGMLTSSVLVPLPEMIESGNPLPAPLAKGDAVFYQVVPKASVQTSAVGALQAVMLAAQSVGMAVVGSLTLPVPSDSGDRWLAICKPSAVSTLARVGTKWAVLLDPTRQFMPAPPAAPPGGGGGAGTPPGSPPGIPGIPAPPGGGGGAWTPPGSPPGIPGGNGGGWNPPTPPPGFPADDVPFGTPPGVGDGLDASMPSALRNEVLAMLADPNIQPEALEAMAAELEGDYPLAAGRLRARALELRALDRAEAIKKGGYEFTIRSGDIPSKLAAYYTGNAGRWKEIRDVNPGMQIVTVNGVTNLKPWSGTILLPLSWNVSAKPLPPVAGGGGGGGNDWPGVPYAESATGAPADVVITEELVVSKGGYEPAPKVSGSPRRGRKGKKA